MYKQRLPKVIFCIALAFSVFLYNEDYALADEYYPQINIYDNTGSYHVSFSNSFSNTSEAQYVSGEYNGHISYYMTVEPGYVYNGTVQRLWEIPYRTGTMQEIIYYAMNLMDYTITNPAEGVNANLIVVNTGSSLRITLDLTFTDYYQVGTNHLGGTFVIRASQIAVTSNGQLSSCAYAAVPVPATDTAGHLVRSLPGEVNLGGVVTDTANQQMQQQQQIANQQSQQSAQQHEDLKQGFTDNTYNNNVSNAGSQVDSYIDLEHNLLEQQNQQMNDYADTAFNLNTISPYINAIAMTSTFFTWIWNGFGEMSVVFVIVLAIGVACLILGIRRRG